MYCPKVFKPLIPLASLCKARGGRALVVGGAVRDQVMLRHGRNPWPSTRQGSPSAPADLDVEVHGIPAQQLEEILRRLGRINLVGQSFAVYKLRLKNHQVDVSLPRRDNKVGPGHRGIVVGGDPFMGIKEASRRRDLTINSMAMDPLDGTLHDPFAGQEDIRMGILRATDPDTFVEDPLRSLRVLQFAARFRFSVDQELGRLCSTMPIFELPRERVRGEFKKLLLKAANPSIGLLLGQSMGIWAQILPQVARIDLSRLGPQVDRAAGIRCDAYKENDPRSESLLLASVLQGLHRDAQEDLLDRLVVYRIKGFPLRKAVLFLTSIAPSLRPPLADGRLRLLAHKAQPHGGLALLLNSARSMNPEGDWDRIMQRASGMGLFGGVPARLVTGADLGAMGVARGPEMGILLDKLYDMQLRKGIESRERLLSAARTLVAGNQPDPPPGNPTKARRRGHP